MNGLKMNHRSIAAPLFAFLYTAAVAWAQTTAPVVLVGGSVPDLSSFGRSAHDVRDAAIVIEGGRITAFGPARTVRLPPHARVVNVRGKYILPGFIDGFGAVSGQAFADAYLYMGVTSVITPGFSDPRRGLNPYRGGDPGPAVLRFGPVNSFSEGRRLSDAELESGLRSLAKSGHKAVLLHYQLELSQLALAVRVARELGLATIGELGASSYEEALSAGVNSFVHTSRYSLPIVPPDLRAEVAKSPFGPPRLAMYEFYRGVSAKDANLQRYAGKVARSGAGLMPTLAMSYLAFPGHENPWNHPSARKVDPKDIHLPADRTTGEPERPAIPSDSFPPGVLEAMIRNIDPAYVKAGCHFLTGSGTSAFGTIPGYSLHTEIRLLHQIGLSNREALAAATWNFHSLYSWMELGEIAAERRADVVVFAKNHVEDLRNLDSIELVILGGRVFERPQLLHH